MGSVVFNLNGELIVDNDYYYAIPLPPPGSYTLTATPYSEPDGQGEAGTPLTVSFTVVGEIESPITLFPNAGPDATYYDLNNDGSTLVQLDASASAPKFRSLRVTSAGRLVLEKITIRGGDPGGSHNGGGIRNLGTLELRNSIVEESVARDGAGSRGDSRAESEGAMGAADVTWSGW